MKKLTKGILSSVCLSKVIPRRHERTYKKILAEYGVETATPSESIIIYFIAMMFIKSLDVMDMNTLYGVTLDLVKDGQTITTLAEQKEKQREIEELLPKIQKMLLGWIAAYNDGRKRPSAQIGELNRMLADIDS